MTNGLTAVLADVRHNAIAVRKPLFAGNLRDNRENMRNRRAVALVKLVDAADVLFRNNENMRFRHRVYVAESENFLVLVNLG